MPVLASYIIKKWEIVGHIVFYINEPDLLFAPTNINISDGNRSGQEESFTRDWGILGDVILENTGEPSIVCIIFCFV